MHDSGFVCSRHAAQDLVEPVSEYRRLEATSFSQNLAQRLAPEQLHDQIGPIRAQQTIVIHDDNVRVSEPRRGLLPRVENGRSASGLPK
jgi:hypothetical protein